MHGEPYTGSRAYCLLAGSRWGRGLASSGFKGPHLPRLQPAEAVPAEWRESQHQLVSIHHVAEPVLPAVASCNK